MRGYTHVWLLGAVFALGCSSSTENVSPCGGTPGLALDAHAAPVASDGSIVIDGTTRFAPDVDAGGAAAEVSGERAVEDIYVGGARVQQTDFNFRAWSVTIPGARLCAHTGADGTKASLPISVYVGGSNGVCVLEIPASERVEVTLPEGSCERSDAGGADG